MTDQEKLTNPDSGKLPDPPAEPEDMTVREAIARRVSCRAYQPRAVPEDQLVQILEAARLARPPATGGRGALRWCSPVRASVTGVDYPWVDIGITGQHLVLAATELGLGTCWIGWIKPRVVRRIVGWPGSVKPVAVITVGADGIRVGPVIDLTKLVVTALLSALGVWRALR